MIIHVLSILCWHMFCFPKTTCFIYIKNTSLTKKKHRSITLTWGCLCGKGMPFWRIKGVPFMRCISTHKWIWRSLCGRRVMRRHIAWLPSMVSMTLVAHRLTRRTAVSVVPGLKHWYDKMFCVCILLCFCHFIFCPNCIICWQMLSFYNAISFSVLDIMQSSWPTIR